MGDIKARSQRRSAALAIISKLQLSQAAFGKLSMHMARKCLEVKLQRFPVVVRRSMQKQRGAPLACPAGTRAPRSQTVRRYFPSRQALFLNEEQRECLELHIRSMKLERLGNRLISGSPLKPAVPQEEESASTYVTAPSEASWAEASPKGHRRQPRKGKKCPSRGKSTRGAKVAGSSFPPARVTFCGVQETTTSYRTSLLHRDPDSGQLYPLTVAAPTNKKVLSKIRVIPQAPRISPSKPIHVFIKERKGQAR